MMYRIIGYTFYYDKEEIVVCFFNKQCTVIVNM